MDTDNTEAAPKRYLIVAEHRVGHGSGHLHRCARLALGLSGPVDWLLPQEPSPEHYSRAAVLDMLGHPDAPVRWIDEPDGPYDVVILDRRSVDAQELSRYDCDGIFVGIDLAGSGRDVVNYVVDTLGRPPDTARPNVADPGLLFLPDAVRSAWPTEIRRILVVFGGEGGADRAVGRAAELRDALSGSGAGDYPAREITVVVPGDTELPDGVSALATRGGLPDHLHRFDLVVTHYGLTAYEATWARVPVILVNPSSYHERLSRSAGFVTAPSIAAVAGIVDEIPTLVAAGQRVRPAGRSDLAALIDGLRVPERRTVPVSDARLVPAIERFAERTFFRDPATGLVFMQPYRAPTVAYDHDYFFSEYQRQYGRTYLEDFGHIRQMGMHRLQRIRRATPSGQRREQGERTLLDIGCAYGPFLQAARDSGYRVTGVDVAIDAVEYVNQTLGIPAIVADVRSLSRAAIGGPFDVVTMWYVIEHFADLDTVLERVAALLPVGGLFAFSSPHGAGISARRDRREFLRRSPDDHYTILDRRSLEAILPRYGMRLRRFVVTGHHPERFGVELGRRGQRGRGLRYRVVRLFSRIAGLGDTFEAIAERVR